MARFVGELLKEHAGQIWADKDWRGRHQRIRAHPLYDTGIRDGRRGDDSAAIVAGIREHTTEELATMIARRLERPRAGGADEQFCVGI